MSRPRLSRAFHPSIPSLRVLVPEAMRALGFTHLSPENEELPCWRAPAALACDQCKKNNQDCVGEALKDFDYYAGLHWRPSCNSCTAESVEGVPDDNMPDDDKVHCTQDLSSWVRAAMANAGVAWHMEGEWRIPRREANSHGDGGEGHSTPPLEGHSTPPSDKRLGAEGSGTRRESHTRHVGSDRISRDSIQAVNSASEVDQLTEYGGLHENDGDDPSDLDTQDAFPYMAVLSDPDPVPDPVPRLSSPAPPQVMFRSKNPEVAMMVEARSVLCRATTRVVVHLKSTKGDFAVVLAKAVVRLCSATLGEKDVDVRRLQHECRPERETMSSRKGNAARVELDRLQRELRYLCNMASSVVDNRAVDDDDEEALAAVVDAAVGVSTIYLDTDDHAVDRLRHHGASLGIRRSHRSRKGKEVEGRFGYQDVDVSSSPSKSLRNNWKGGTRNRVDKAVAAGDGVVADDATSSVVADDLTTEEDIGVPSIDADHLPTRVIGRTPTDVPSSCPSINEDDLTTGYIERAPTHADDHVMEGDSMIYLVSDDDLEEEDHDAASLEDGTDDSDSVDMNRVFTMEGLQAAHVALVEQDRYTSITRGMHFRLKRAARDAGVQLEYLLWILLETYPDLMRRIKLPLLARGHDQKPARGQNPARERLTRAGLNEAKRAIFAKNGLSHYGDSITERLKFFAEQSGVDYIYIFAIVVREHKDLLSDLLDAEGPRAQSTLASPKRVADGGGRSESKSESGRAEGSKRRRRG